MPQLDSSTVQILKYASIPFVAAIVGWATNWVAVKMTFKPLEFVGLGRFLGWQGIVPSKAEKMAAIFVDSTMYRLGRVSEVFREMEPQRIAQQILEYVSPRMDEYTDEIMLQHQAILWDNMPAVLKNEVYQRVRAELPHLVENLMDDVEQKVEELVDLKQMITEQLVADKALLNRLFQESGEDEFRFIVRSGLTFGFLFGLVQLVVYVLYPAWWILPLFGLLVGYATNWIALNIIFRPLEERKIGPWRLQGLFLKRQPEVAAVWCRIVTREILTVRALIHHMMTGPRSERTLRLVRRHIKPLVDEATGIVKPAAQVMVGIGGFSDIKTSVGEKAIDVSTEPFDDPVFNEDRAVVVERLMRQRMEQLPSEEFQDLLRPCFQEDEMKLILLGAALGCAAGFAQLFLVFGGMA